VAGDEDYVELIADRTPMRAVPMPLSTREPAHGGVGHHGLPARLSAVLVVGLSARSRPQCNAGSPTAGDRAVIAHIDAVTAASAAAVMTILRSRGVKRRGHESY